MPAPYNPLAAGQAETCSYPCGNPAHDHRQRNEWTIRKQDDGYGIYDRYGQHSVWPNMTEARKCLYWAQRATASGTGDH